MSLAQIKLIDIYDAAERYGISLDRMKSIVYQHAGSPQPIAYKKNKIGRKRPQFSETEMDAYIEQLKSLSEKSNEQMDFAEISKYFNNSPTFVRYLFRNDPMAPKPLKIIGHGRHIYRKSDVIAFHKSIRPHGNKSIPRKKTQVTEKIITPEYHQPFDNALARKFITSAHGLHYA